MEVEEAEPHVKPIDIYVKDIFTVDLETIVKFASRLKFTVCNKMSMNDIDKAMTHIDLQEYGGIVG